MKKLFTLFFCCALFASSAYADAARSGSRFLLLGAGARAAGMGSAFTGLANDVSAAYWNPAGLTGLSGIEMLSMYNSWFEGINHFYAAVGMKLANGHALGFQLNALDAGALQRLDSAGVQQGTFSAGDIAMVMTCARSFGSRLSLGSSVKMIRSTLENESGMGFGIDVGSLYRLSPKLGLGFTAQNIGSGVKFIRETTPLPFLLRAGLGYRFIEDEKKEVTLSGDATMLPLDDSIAANIGGEVVLNRMLALRTGVKIGSSIVPALGIGFRLNDISVDWASEFFNDLGSPCRLSVTMKWR